MKRATSGRPPRLRIDAGFHHISRVPLHARLPFGFTDPTATNLNRTTVQQYRLLRPMPHFDGANVATSEPPRGDSYYNALQLKWDKRFSHGVSTLAHYTWSKMIDNVSHSSGNVGWLGGSTSIQNIWDLDSERSLSAHDVPHRVVVTGIWQMFSKPPTDVPGTAPRTLSYRGPSIRIFDAALMKNIAVRGGQRMEFRIEAQNVLNHPIFGDPNTSFGSTAFGVITNTKIGPRQVMLGVKYHF